MSTDHPRAVVGVFVLNGRGELLLVKSPKWLKDYWIVPGGHVDYGEGIAHAAEREAFEETCLRARFQKVFAVFESIFSPAFARKRHFIFLECLCRTPGKKVALDGKELTDCKWVEPTQALRLRLEPTTRQGIKALLRELRGGNA